jgi:phage baseplate assembly protein gpV
MADSTDFKNMIRKGTVHSVNEDTMKARVKFADKGGIISGELSILSRPQAVVPSDGSTTGNQTAQTQLSYDKNESMTTESHSHKAYVTQWTPKIGEMVLCICTPDGDGEGFILGGI